MKKLCSDAVLILDTTLPRCYGQNYTKIFKSRRLNLLAYQMPSTFVSITTYGIDFLTRRKFQFRQLKGVVRLLFHATFAFLLVSGASTTLAQWNPAPDNVRSRLTSLILPDGTRASVLRMDCLPALAIFLEASNRSSETLSASRCAPKPMMEFSQLVFFGEGSDSDRLSYFGTNEFDAREKRKQLIKELEELRSIVSEITFIAIPVKLHLDAYDFDAQGFPVRAFGTRSEPAGANLRLQFIECFVEIQGIKRESWQRICFRAARWQRSGLMPVSEDIGRALRASSVPRAAYAILSLPDALKFKVTQSADTQHQIADIDPVAIVVASSLVVNDIWFYSSIERRRNEITPEAKSTARPQRAPVAKSPSQTQSAPKRTTVPIN